MQEGFLKRMTHVADQTDNLVFILYCMSYKKKPTKTLKAAEAALVSNSNGLLSANVLL